MFEQIIYIAFYTEIKQDCMLIMIYDLIVLYISIVIISDYTRKFAKQMLKQTKAIVFICITHTHILCV